MLESSGTKSGEFVAILLQSTVHTVALSGMCSYAYINYLIYLHACIIRFHLVMLRLSKIG